MLHRLAWVTSAPFARTQSATCCFHIQALSFTNWCSMDIRIHDVVVCVRRGGGVAQGLGIRLLAFGSAYWPLATAHSDPLWVRTCLVVSTEPLDDLSCLTTPASAVPETGCCPCRGSGGGGVMQLERVLKWWGGGAQL